MNRLWLVLGIVAAIAAVLAGWLVFSRQGESMAEFKDDRISFSYPKDYQPQALLPPERNAKNLLRLTMAKPLSTIELNKETGAIIGANVTKTPFLDYLVKNAERNFSKIYSDYQKLSSERLTLSGQPVQHIKFSYTGRDKTTKLYMQAYIITSGNDAYYLYIQSADQKRSDDDAKKIQATIQLR